MITGYSPSSKTAGNKFGLVQGKGYTAWIEEVWVNYIGNAVKHGKRGMTVEVGMEETQDGKMIRYWVRDNGPGIPEDRFEDLFLPFTRLAQAKIEGHGLGLSIVRRIVDGGREVGISSLRADRLDDELLALMRERILVMDGATGTMLQSRDLGPDDFGGPELEGCNEHLVVTRPDVILDVHRAYLAAGRLPEAMAAARPVVVPAEAEPIADLSPALTSLPISTSRSPTQSTASPPPFRCGERPSVRSARVRVRSRAPRCRPARPATGQDRWHRTRGSSASPNHAPSAGARGGSSSTPVRSATARGARCAREPSR